MFALKIRAEAKQKWPLVGTTVYRPLEFAANKLAGK
jgi:hypothetical protein